MGLEKDRHIPELYYLKHKHDNKLHTGFNWQDNILKNTTSPYVWKNPTMNKYLSKIEKMVSLMVEKMSVARNFFNYTVPKYYDEHWG
jgi:hypothetical protein